MNATSGEGDRVMVTGAAGFVGSHLAEALVARGHSVIGVDRRTPASDPIAARNLDALLDHPRFDFQAMDVGDREMPGLLAEVRTVFHLAAATGVRTSWGHGFAEYVACNVLATQRLMEYCQAAQVPRMVIASSSSIYGEPTGRPTRESDAARPLSPYGASKLAAEQLALAYAGRPDQTTSVIALRYFTMYGPRQRGDMAIARMFQAALTGRPMRLYGDGSQRRSFTYVDDAVEATIQAARLDARAEVVNVAGGVCVTLAETRDLIAQITGLPVPVVERGPHAGDVAVTDGDTAKARRLLGYRPKVALADGLGRQWRWLNDHPHRLTASPAGRTA